MMAEYDKLKGECGVRFEGRDDIGPELFIQPHGGGVLLN